MAEPAKGNNNMRIVIIVILIVAGYYVYQKYLKTSTPITAIAGPVIYDTNPQNDSFIKGTLTAQQLAQFDKILEFEKSQNSMRISQNKLKELAANDLALYEAYNRWRKCMDMMRSTHHTVYPSERKLYQQK
jgi:hypothetical protein